MNVFWALPQGSGYTLQVRAPCLRCGLFIAIPNASKLVVSYIIISVKFVLYTNKIISAIH